MGTFVLYYAVDVGVYFLSTSHTILTASTYRYVHAIAKVTM